MWFRAWLNNTDRLIITSGPTCSKTRSRRELLGGISNPNYLKNSLDKEVFDALNFAVCAINDASNDLFFSKLGDTSGVTYTQQVTDVALCDVQTAANCCRLVCVMYAAMLSLKHYQGEKLFFNN